MRLVNKDYLQAYKVQNSKKPTDLTHYSLSLQQQNPHTTSPFIYIINKNFCHPLLIPWNFPSCNTIATTKILSRKPKLPL
jgi:hypothetical protein